MIKVGDIFQKLRERLRLKKVIIFGSYPKKKYTAFSDIDILVVYEGGEGERDTVYKTLRRSLHLRQVELHILMKDEYESLRETKWIKTILNEGVTVLDVPNDHRNDQIY